MPILILRKMVTRPFMHAEIPLDNGRGRGVVKFAVDSDADKIVAETEPSPNQDAPYFIIPGWQGVSSEQMAYLAEALRNKPEDMPEAQPDWRAMLQDYVEQIKARRVY